LYLAGCELLFAQHVSSLAGGAFGRLQGGCSYLRFPLCNVSWRKLQRGSGLDATEDRRDNNRETHDIRRMSRGRCGAAAGQTARPYIFISEKEYPHW